MNTTEQTAQPFTAGVGTLVTIRNNVSFAVITEVFNYGDKTLYHCHYLSKAGRKLRCLDKRCHGEHTCPIHGANVERKDLTVLPIRDVEFYESEGLISPKLAAIHKATQTKGKRHA
jgi:hypothetical protein